MGTLNMHYCIDDRKDFPKLSQFASWPGTIINPQLLELSMSQTIFHGTNDVRSTEIRLYFVFQQALLLKYSEKKNNMQRQQFIMSGITLGEFNKFVELGV